MPTDFLNDPDLTRMLIMQTNLVDKNAIKFLNSISGRILIIKMLEF